MQETLYLLPYGNPSLPCLKPSNSPSQNHDFPRPRTRLHFPILCSKTITAIPAPSKPAAVRIRETPVPSPLKPPPPPSDFQEKMYYLDSIGLDVFSLATDHRPILLAASLPEIKSVIEFLASMDFTAQDFRRIVSMCPEFLSASTSTIIPVFTFLLREAGVQGSDIRRVIHRRPRLLVSSVKHRLRPSLYFLQSIGITAAYKHTYLLSCSVEEKLVPRIQYFEEIGFSRRDAAAMFRRFPQLFNYSIRDNIEPKLNYFVVEMGRELKELKEFPQYFSFSLENRIKPRHQCCVEKGVCLPLPLLLKMKDVQFRERLQLFCESSLPFSSSPLYRVDFDPPL